VLLSLLFLGLLGGSYYAFAPILFLGETTVPNVVGMTEEQALQELKKYNLNMDVKERKESNDVKKGLVMEQDPEAQESVRQGRPIEVKVSAGPRLVKVPNVVTYGLREAETMLQNNEFEPLFDPEADYEYDEKISKDIVIRQDPGAGEMKPRGIQVRLTVSKGPEPKQIFMPDLRTKPLADAKKEITAANLAEGPVTEEASGEYAPGQVIRQTPEANTPVLEGSEVALVVSNGPGPPTQTARVWVDVPDDGSDHVVRVMVLDSRGTTQVYLETHPPGDRVRLDDVRFLGKGKIQVYVDDVLREQKLVPE
jgi:beta-lactam-binding protein with PASTA domain